MCLTGNRAHPDRRLVIPRNIRVADEIWLATASHHRSHPDRADFTVGEIVRRAETDNVTGILPLRPGVRDHVYLHCVANKPPNPGRYRMHLETRAGRRRLFRPGDPCHPRRMAGKHIPKRDEIPTRHEEPIDWYIAEFAARAIGDTRDPILSLRGLGKEIWADEAADDYVLRQRSGWS